MALIQITDTIEFAREIASDIQAHELPTEDIIQAAVDVMNHHLFGVRGNTRALLRADAAYLIPTDQIEAELLLTEQEIADARVDNAIMRTKIDSFTWFGSTALTGFGLRTFGVDLLAPEPRHVDTAFIPLEAVGVRLAT